MLLSAQLHRFTCLGVLVDVSGPPVSSNSSLPSTGVEAGSLWPVAGSKVTKVLLPTIGEVSLKRADPMLWRCGVPALSILKTLQDVLQLVPGKRGY